MKTIPLMVTTLGLMLALSMSSPVLAKGHVVTYLTLTDNISREDSAAIAWLERSSRFVPRRLSIDGLAAKGIPRRDVVWIHIPDSAEYQSWLPHLSRLQLLRRHFQQGGRLLLTDFAAFLPYELGIEQVRPEVRSFEITDDWLFDQKGLQGFRGHPVFDGLFGGTFIWDPNVDQRLPAVGYFGEGFPKGGKVVAIGKSYVFLHPDQRLMVEYTSLKGKALSIGSMVYFGRENNRRLNLERFMQNSLLYLVGDLRGTKITYWEQAECRPKPLTVRSEPLNSAPQRVPHDLPHSSLLLTRGAPQNDFYDVAGRRALVMGYENGGIDELWVHPFRVVRNYQAGLIVSDSVAWLHNFPVRIDVRPESFTRTYTTPFGQLREIVFASLTRPGALVHYEFGDVSRQQLVVKFRSDLRFMWPYDERALGDICFGYDEGLGALHVRDASGDFSCVIGGDRKPRTHLSGPYGDIKWESGNFAGTATEANQVYHASLYGLSADKTTLTLAFVGTDEGSVTALKEYRALLSSPWDEYARVVRHYEQLLQTSVRIGSPDQEFNALFQWALVGTDRFVTTTSQLGTALVAGFATTARGWDGGHKINGRPGYAWYFGRDSEWSCFAIDDYGDFTTVKTQLEFLQKYQDLSGKIFHEVSTSGVVHYDASDATPLYVILAAHYLRASGDTEFIRKSWGHLKKAMDFLYSTDTDGDGLIENTNVGHGWIEGGKLWPVHTEFYLAGLWAQALKDAATIASHLGKTALGERYRSDGARVERILNKDFWNPMTVCYSYGKKKDGSFNYEPTVLPAAVMYFNLLESGKVGYVLDRYASNGFSTDWGVRIVNFLSTLYNPQGYHYGSVWPLFTGWTALGEYEYGNSTQGFMHIANSLYIKNHWALGYVEEVMHGAVYKPTGVCPHQCWSETNILHPAITGMTGWKPDATKGWAGLKPRFPLHWDTVTVSNLRVGNSVVQFTMERGINATRYRFNLQRGSQVSVSFAPELPQGMAIQEAQINGRRIERTFEMDRGVLAKPFEFPLLAGAEVLLKHTNGVGILPVMPRPVPGDSSLGSRVIRSQLEGRVYTVDVEGKAGTAAQFEVRLFDQGIVSVEGAEIVGRSAKDILRLRVSFGPSRTGYSIKKIALHIEER